MKLNQTQKEQLFRKLTSRKFWLTTAGLIASLCAAIGCGDALAARVSAIITAGGIVVAYVFGESLADASGASTDRAPDCEENQNRDGSGQA